MNHVQMLPSIGRSEDEALASAEIADAAHEEGATELCIEASLDRGQKRLRTVDGEAVIEIPERSREHRDGAARTRGMVVQMRETLSRRVPRHDGGDGEIPQLRGEVPQPRGCRAQCKGERAAITERASR